MLELFRRDIKTESLIFNNINMEQTTVTPMLCMQHINWMPSDESCLIERAIDRFDLAIKSIVTSLNLSKKFNHTMLKVILFSFELNNV